MNEKRKSIGGAEKLAILRRYLVEKVFALPASHRRRLRTTNVLERLNRELKRRTRVATLFPNEAALLRGVTGVLVEISDGSN